MPTQPTDAGLMNRIDLNQDLCIGYWKHEFNCTADELLAAMESVGTDASEVAQFLEAAR